MSIYGIAIRPGGRPVQAQEAKAMCASLRSGFAEKEASRVLPHVGIGSVSSTGSTSCWFSDAVLSSCDAELYNLQELRGMLRGVSDTVTTAELLGRLYLDRGASFIEHLRGAFSLAIWDEKKRTLLLALDRFGIKQLCYAANENEIVYATYPRGIFGISRIAKKINLSAITEYFNYNVVPSPRTAFEGVSKVEPATHLLFSSTGLQARQYWEMRYPEDASGSEKDLARELFDRLEESVRVTAADLDSRTTGCFLSGGTDSSSVVGLLTKAKGCPQKAFSIGFREKRFNEMEYARIAAQHFGASHSEYVLGPEEVFDTIEKVVAAYDDPFGNSSAIPTYCCAKLARDKGVDVLLAGDGGDELFGGNERYRIDQIFEAYQRIPRLIRHWILEPAVSANPLSVGVFGKARRYIRQSNTPNPERYCQWRLLQRFSPQQVLGSEMPFTNGHSDLLARMREHYNTAPASSELNRLLFVDVKMTLGDDDLPKVTRTAELAGVNVRFPYLDHKLAEFTGRLPSSLKLRYFEKRYIFKQATRTLLPPQILQKKKHGFGLPIGVWLKTDSHLHNWARDVLFDARTYQRGYFQRSFIEQLFSEMQNDNTSYYGDLLWVFFVLELWYRRHIEGGAS